MAIDRVSVRRIAMALSFMFGFTRAAYSAPGINDDLVRAAKNGDAAKCKSLLAQGADPNQRINPHDVYGLGSVPVDDATTLDAAGYACRLEAFQTLLDGGAKFSSPDNATLLLCRSSCMLKDSSGSGAFYRQLIKLGGDPNGRVCVGMATWLPLHGASYHNNMAFARALIESGADMNIRNEVQWTALHGAKPGMIDLLVQGGTDPCLKNGRGQTALDFAREGAAKYGDQTDIPASIPPLEAVSKKCAPAKTAAPARDEGSLTPDQYLLKAASMGDFAAVSYAIAHGADVKARDANGWTPILHAAMAGQTALVKTMIAAGADPDARGPGGTTPLILACRHGHVDTALALIAKRADANAKDSTGRRAEDWARLENKQEILAMFKKLAAMAKSR